VGPGRGAWCGGVPAGVGRGAGAWCRRTGRGGRGAGGPRAWGVVPEDRVRLVPWALALGVGSRGQQVVAKTARQSVRRRRRGCRRSVRGVFEGCSGAGEVLKRLLEDVAGHGSGLYADRSSAERPRNPRNSVRTMASPVGAFIARQRVVARIPRRAVVQENSVNHCTWRSHDNELVLDVPEAKREFLRLLRAFKVRYGILILAYCVMGTHPHVVCVATKGQQAFSRFWQIVNHRFARWYNRRHGRRGQVVMERLSSPQIQDDRYLIEAIRYVDLNPVKAKLVARAKDWAWSSHRHYALGEPDDLVDDAPAYLNLGRNAIERRIAYRHLFAMKLVTTFLLKRPDLVARPFVGDERWVEDRLRSVSRPSG
jgi:putative transposase